MNDILFHALTEIEGLINTPLDVLDIKKPVDIDYARHLFKVLSKLSPLMGNMIEFFIPSVLNKKRWGIDGQWIRQDPSFPDIIFMGEGVAQPIGIEIKTWFPLATEITARFRESQLRLTNMPIEVVVVAWLPEYILYGKPVIVDIWHDNALSFASARDTHYHNPPDYLVIEPFDTTTRTLNLQQTNTNGYKFQGDEAQFEHAQRIVASWGIDGKQYSPNLGYQLKLADLQSQFPYRLDTNFAKIDRIQHTGLEIFKKQVMSTSRMGYTLAEWAHKNIGYDESLIKKLLE
ncbi:MAG: hypothetical protein KJ043_02545 [Anaerolineae bacterium]|nr:hypothetical protein [Anaerolineae bacterium]